ncbi:hypothetical protein [Ramlibacter tataouinensis]|nr:hypothetical protein [Ramlibacter tataouinensis]
MTEEAKRKAERLANAGQRRRVVDTWQLHVLLVSCVFAAAVYSSRLASGHDWGDDFGAYLHLAQNIRLGRPYDYLTPEMGAMTPPGFPLLLVFWSHLTSWDLAKLKTVNVFSWCLLAIATYRLARYYVSASNSLAVAIAVLCCPFFIFAQQDLISDMPYAALNTTCLCLASAASVRQPHWRQIGWLCLLCIGVFTAFLFRPATVGLVAALVGYQSYLLVHTYVRTRSYNWLALTAATLLVLTTLLFIALFPGPFNAHGTNAVASGQFYSFTTRSSEEFKNFSNLFFGFVAPPWAPKVFLIFAFVGSLLGAINRRELTPIHFFALAYPAMIMLTPWNGGPRYLFPMVPVIFIFVAMLGESSRRTASAWIGKVGALIILLYVAVNGARQVNAAQGYSTDEIEKPKAMELFGWLKANTRADETLCAFKPRAFLYLTQRRTQDIGFTAYPSTGEEYLRALHCAYAVVPNPNALGGLYDAVSVKLEVDPTMLKIYDNTEYSVFIPARAKR